MKAAMEMKYPYTKMLAGVPFSTMRAQIRRYAKPTARPARITPEKPNSRKGMPKKVEVKVRSCSFFLKIVF